MTDYLGNPVTVSGVAPLNVLGNPVIIQGYAPLNVFGNPVFVLSPRVWFVKATPGGVLRPVQVAVADETVRPVTP